jgi:drug/metabolite transporter (DMT)-like permease
VFIAWTVWAWANSKVGVARPSLFMVLVPVISGAVAWWYLDEQVRLLQIVGLLLVVSGLLVARRRPATPSAPSDNLTERASVSVRSAGGR